MRSKKTTARQLMSEDDVSYLGKIEENAGPEYRAWFDLNETVRRKGGAIPWKYRELIALAVAETTQCILCVQAHVRAAQEAGASRQEIAETTVIAAALRAGGAIAHGAVALRFFDEALEELPTSKQQSVTRGHPRTDSRGFP